MRGSCGGSTLCRMIPDGAPSGAYGTGYVGVGVVAYHQMVGGVEVVDALHGVVIYAYVGFVDAYVVAEHYDVDVWFESG